MAVSVNKNFLYGELWPACELPGIRGRGRVKIRPSKITSNPAFIKYLKEWNYLVYLDYNHRSYAYTDVSRREIVLNGNCSEIMISSLLKHELGHLMLFDVNQFVTVGRQTLRSIITKVIYTPNNLIKYGTEQLLYAENVIQDIIIETVSNGNCVCHNALIEFGENVGVKHLSNLESAKHIAEESCKNLLVPKEDYNSKHQKNELSALLDVMLKDLKKDIQEVSEKISEIDKTVIIESRAKRKIFNEQNKVSQKLERIKKMESSKKGLSEKLKDIKEKLEEQLKTLESEEHYQEVLDKESQSKQSSIDLLESKISRLKEIADLLEESKNTNNQEPNESGESDESEMGIEPGTDGSSESLENSDSQELNKNLTDHLHNSEDSSVRDNPSESHSMDCGLPIPVTVTRDESYANERNITKLNTANMVKKKIEIRDEDFENIISTNKKINKKEFTYFKTHKKEDSPSDMMQGKRKLRTSGINVLIGLDISGSMSREWGEMFNKLSEMIEKLNDTLEIERIVYFTYDTKVKDFSYDIKDLKISACGGNAFGYVYQEVMKTLPISQRNEIILVTDCGDNLGFDLDSSCIAERKGEKVKNHISIIDTEGAGFYDKDGFKESEWSLHHCGDKNLFKEITSNIEKLINY